MPFINSRVNVSMSDTQKISLKEKLGEAISMIPGKSENWLMIEFADNCDLFFRGANDAPIAFIEVKVYGNVSPDSASQLTAAICRIYKEELNISPDHIYVKYEDISKWGWNGSNF